MPHSSASLYNAAQIREAERIAIQQLDIPASQLMRLAGQAVFNAICQRWPLQRSMTVFCGSGNNAGDGYVVAELAITAGFEVTVFALAAPESLPDAAQAAYQRFIAVGGRVQPLAITTACQGIVVDALLGTGLNRAVNQTYAQAIHAINAAQLPVVAVDVPSGLHADSGNILGVAVNATLTITFIGLKTGLHTGMAAECCGEIILEPLALPASILASIKPVANLARKTPLASRSRSAHKGSFGHVLLIGGNHGYSGAIRLAGEACLRSGAGLVSIASRAAHSGYLNIGRPELMCHGVETADQLTDLISKASVIAIGPGLGQDDWASHMLRPVFASDKPLVVDADALNLLAKQPQQRHNWLLTPHPGEAARLLACSTANIAQDRYAAVTALQANYGGVVVLKGAGSLISDGQQVLVATTGNPGMASGGMGDVLTGISAALIAQGLPLLAAAELAVMAHGEAADRAAKQQGERGLLAGDLLAELRMVLNC